MKSIQENNVLILNSRQIEQKISRMVYQVYENNFEEKDIIIAGINKRGQLLANIISDQLKKISKISVRIAALKLDKSQPHKNDIVLDIPVEEMQNKTILLVDDVLNTGKTLFYSIRPLLKIPLKKLQVLVLVHRSHNNFPVMPDYFGISLSTTIQEHISVDLESSEWGIYLS